MAIGHRLSIKDKKNCSLFFFYNHLISRPSRPRPFTLAKAREHIVPYKNIQKKYSSLRDFDNDIQNNKRSDLKLDIAR